MCTVHPAVTADGDPMQHAWHQSCQTASPAHANITSKTSCENRRACRAGQTSHDLVSRPLSHGSANSEAGKQQTHVWNCSSLCRNIQHDWQRKPRHSVCTQETQLVSKQSFRKTQRKQGCHGDCSEAISQACPPHVETPSGYNRRNYLHTQLPVCELTWSRLFP